MSFLPDNKTLAIVGDDGIELWNVETGSQISKIDVAVKDFSASTDCRTWLIDDDNSVAVWDGATGKPIRTLWRSRESLNMAIVCFGFFATIIAWGAVRAKQRRAVAKTNAEQGVDDDEEDASPVTESSAREPDLPQPPDA